MRRLWSRLSNSFRVATRVQEMQASENASVILYAFDVYYVIGIDYRCPCRALALAFIRDTVERRFLCYEDVTSEERLDLLSVLRFGII